MMRYLLLSILLFGLIPVPAQNQAGKLGLEITKLNVGLNAGPYRGRTKATDGPFDQGIATYGQIYFPFQFAADYRLNFTDSAKVINEYNERILLIRPSAIFHFVDNGSMAFGLGLQLSFRTVKDFYLEYQLGGVYIEANDAGAPDLHDGFNLHHFVSLTKPVSRRLSVSLGIVHLSGAGLSDGPTSAQDVITLGIKMNLNSNTKDSH